MPKQVEETRQPVTHNLVRFVVRLTKYGACAALAIALVLSIAYALHIDGSGWALIQTGNQSRTMYRLKMLEIAITDYQELTGELPTAENATDLQGALRRTLNRDLSVNDGWNQPLGYALRGHSILIWSTGFGGGYPGAMPDILPPRQRQFPQSAFESDTVLLWGSGVEFQLSCRGESPCFVQVVEGRVQVSEGPFGVGRLFAGVVYILSGGRQD